MKKRLLALLIISIITTGLFACNDKEKRQEEVHLLLALMQSLNHMATKMIQVNM